MTIVATYNDAEELGRVRLSFSGYNAIADYATVERSTDQITWETIRGGAQVPLTAGAGSIDDYEFVASVPNYYRVSSIDTGDPTLVTPASIATGNNASVTPSVSGFANDDLMILMASIRNSGTGTVNQPAGWDTIVNSGNFRIMTRVKQTGDSNPVVTFNNGAANADTIGVIFALRGSTATGASVGTTTLNASAQNVSTPQVAFNTKDWTIRFFWKQDDLTSFSFGSYSAVFQASTTTGDDASMGAAAIFRTTPPGTSAAGDIVITGGAAAISRGAAISFPKAPYINREIQSITPVVTRWRIKNPSRPSLNTFVEPLPVGSIVRPGRTGVFDVLGRTLPVAVTDISGSRRFRLRIDVFGYAQKEDLDRRFASGQVMFLQGPSTIDQLPTLYFVATEVEYEQDAVATGSYTFSIEAIECAKPGPTVFGGTTTWADIVAEFATWSALVAAEPTWSDVVDRISTPEVIVP